jgi:electron transfer flavoprotein alpha subunit
MAVLVYVENWNGSFKKASFEAVSYASQFANKLGTCTIALTIANKDNPEILGKYGASKVITISDCSMEYFSNQAYSNALCKVADKEEVDIIIVSNTNNGKSLSPIIAAKRNSSLITNVIDLPQSIDPFILKTKAFSSKAYVNYTTKNKKKIISITPNSFGIVENELSAEIEDFTYVTTDSDRRLSSLSIDKVSGKIPLTEAELVVSAGRGLKGPENWGMIEELADLLGAATACSKPVSDIGWRSHSEHVGQTGIAINPELYIAIGISGAIQHLAGVNASKNIVVINTDPDAPFFKAADYGIVGDAFEVVPKLINAIKSYQKNN